MEERSAAEKAEEDGENSTDRARDRLAFLCCLLQPPSARNSADESSAIGRIGDYVGVRRLLISRKAEVSPNSMQHRKEWKCNGRGYVAYRNFIRRPRNQESQPSTPGHSGHWASSTGSQSILFDVETLSSSRDFRGINVDISHYPSFNSSVREFHQPPPTAEPAYSFVGMHCIFDGCKASVTIIKFGHMSSDLLAYGASDGSLTVCRVSGIPSVVVQLTGHSKAITDFDFSSNNQYIASSSIDKTVRVWEISKGICIRVIYGTSSQFCIRFHPVNNNFLSIGNGNREIIVINFSTGRVVNKISLENEVTALDNDHTGQIIFAGDSQGYVSSVSISSHTGSLSRSHRHQSGKKKSPITTIQYRTFSFLVHGPVLLVCYQDGNISFMSVAHELRGRLTLLGSIKLAPRVHNVHASFCPLLSLEKGEFIVCGSEDSSVYFYDLTRPNHIYVNKLQGHAAPVIGVAWNQGENLLASSDSDGSVIVWKRAKSQ
ncbi:transducin/WD40 repeat-like superfamily protein [Wolffia australiana]